MLDETPFEFTSETKGWQCKVGYQRITYDEGLYTLQVNDTIAKDLPNAPPIKKENIATVCQSDNLVLDSEVIKRTTFTMFIDGLMDQFIADHNSRSMTTQYIVNDKIIK